MEETVIQAFDRAAEQFASRPALRGQAEGRTVERTWAEYHAEVLRAARAFVKLGLEPGQGVAIIGYNCIEWFVADVAAIYAGGVPAGIYTTSSAEQCQYITDHADAAIVVAEDAAQLAKFKSVRAQLPKVKAFVLMRGHDPDPEVHGWDELLALADEVPESAVRERAAACTPSDCCTLIYTSGTTGQPKAVMISHRNITWLAEATIEAVDLRDGDQGVSYLPLSHIAEQMVSIHGPMYIGACITFAPSIDALGDTLREVRPHYFLGVPRVWEKIQGKMEEAGAASPPLRRKIARWAKGVGLAGGLAEQRGAPKPQLYGLARALVFSKVRDKLGLDRCRIAVTSAAPIARSTLDFFLSLGIPLMEVYGMSESTGPTTVSRPDRYRTGSVGFAVPGTELKIADDGEICMRGPHIFLGYYKNEAATAETIDAEGWLHSGDIGTIDAEGFLRITDRKKELIITAGGENVAPAMIEASLKAIPAVSQAVVIGDRRKYLSALLCLDPDRLPRETSAAGSPAKTIEEAVGCDRFRAHLQAQIDGVNAGLARVQTIKRWSIIPTELTPEGGELTPTLKLKRRVIHDKYAEQIEQLYV
jgi:long-subunit acyl-CoA synthetase (AMP-forming)